MQRMNSNTYTAILLVAIACIALWQTQDLNSMSAMFPQVIGLILLMLSIIYFIVGIIRPVRENPFAFIEKKRVIPLVLGMVGYLLLIWTVGFLIASFTFVAFFVWFLQGDMENQLGRLMRSFVFAFVIDGFFYVLFRYVFFVPLPTGVLFGAG